MTPSEQFKLGFLTRCVEEGLSDPEIDSRVKEAFWPMIGRAAMGLASTAAAVATGPMVANSDYNPLKLLGRPSVLGIGGTGILAGSATLAPEALALVAALAAGGVGAVGYGLGSRAGYENKKQKLQTAVNPASEQQHELVDAYDQHGKLMEAEMLRNKQTVKPKTRSAY